MRFLVYLRLSTERQDEASQMQQVSDYLQREQHAPTVIVKDYASGGQPWTKRKLSTMLNDAGEGDTIIVSEVSRIARSTLGVLSFLQAAAERKVVVVAARNKLVMDESLHSKITVTVLALAADIERQLLRERTTAALDARRQAGLPLGRPKGSRSDSILSSRAAEIEKCLKANVPKRSIARLMGCAPGTLYAYLDRLGIKLTDQEVADLSAASE